MFSCSIERGAVTTSLISTAKVCKWHITYVCVCLPFKYRESKMKISIDFGTRYIRCARLINNETSPHLLMYTDIDGKSLEHFPNCIVFNSHGMSYTIDDVQPNANTITAQGMYVYVTTWTFQLKTCQPTIKFTLHL